MVSSHYNEHEPQMFVIIRLLLQRFKKNYNYPIPFFFFFGLIHPHLSSSISLHSPFPLYLFTSLHLHIHSITFSLLFLCFHLWVPLIHSFPPSVCLHLLFSFCFSLCLSLNQSILWTCS